ncbi:hypothetical protein RhiirA5_437294, partial [Rhizophagus irregularis]
MKNENVSFVNSRKIIEIPTEIPCPRRFKEATKKKIKEKTEGKEDKLEEEAKAEAEAEVEEEVEKWKTKEEYELPSTDEETITNSIKTNKRKSTSKCTNVDTNSTNLDNNSDDDVLSTTHTLSTSTLRTPTPEITLQDEFDLPENINSDTLPEDTNDLQNELHDDSPENTDSLQNISHYLSK